MVNEYTKIFKKNGINLQSFQKNLKIWIFYKFVLKSVNSLNRIFLATVYWFKALKCQIWLTNIKPFFWESEANFETLQKLSPYSWVSYNFVLKSDNSLNRIFLATEYWLKALKCQIWLTKPKLFFWERKAIFGTLQTLSPYIWGSYRFVLKSVNNLNQIFLATKHWFKGFKTPNLVNEYKTIFFGKRDRR